jgi:hypothetical protein
VGDHPLGDVDAVAPGSNVGDVLAPIGFERSAVLVELVAIELGDQVVLGPEAIDQAPVDKDVGLRVGEPMVAQKLQEMALELGLGPGRLVSELVSDRTEGGSALAAAAAGQESIEGAEIEKVSPLNLFHECAQALGMEGLRPIEQRAGQGGDRDPIDDRAVIGVN